MYLEGFQNKPDFHHEQVSCGLCHSENGEFYAYSYDFEYETGQNRWSFDRCLKCGNIYLNPRPTVEELRRIYPSNYYSYMYQSNVSSLLVKAKEILDRSKFRKILKCLNRWPITYLDIGCGNGRYLKNLESMGLKKDQIFGIEIESEVAERLKAEGYNVDHRPFEYVDTYTEEQFDLITLFSVLEHVQSPGEALQKIYSLLSPGGLVVFEVPNPKSINARIFRNYFWGGYHTPRHWNLFSAEAIQKVSEKIGFEFLPFQRSTGHAFWPWSLHHFVKYKLGWNKLGDFLSPHRCWPLVIFATILDTVAGKLGIETDNNVYYLRRPNLK